MRYIKMTRLIAIAFAIVFAQPMMAQSSTFQNVVESELYTEVNQPELYCLAMNIYHEARAELHVGMYAVADVTINRVYDTRYPNTICDVVKDAKMKESWKTKQYPELDDSQRVYIPIRNMCQFSWYCDGRSDAVQDNDSWRMAQEVAYRIVTEKKYRGITEGATHYHATYVSPSWRTSLDLVGRIGTHIFYRWM
jgi:N-acetylmuramoyl-L-alanine amidase